MKKLFTPAIAALSITACLSLLIYACKRPTEGIDLIVKTDALSKSPTLIEYVNANPAGTPMPSSMSVTVTDPLGVVQTDDGGKIFTAFSGLLPLSLSRFSTPSVSTPVSFTIAPKVPTGFVPVINTVNITSDTAATHTIIPLVEYAHPASGTSATVKNTALTAGTSALTTVSLPANGTTEACTITIPAGTQMKDKNGAVINAATLSSSIVYLGTTAPAAYNSFPGGFNPQNVIGTDGKAIAGSVTFITAGYISMNLLAGTTAVKSFSKPITVNMEINSTLINPLTGVKVKVGDVIPVWSYDETAGQWKYESTATVIKNTNGNLAANISVTHLTGWSLDWYSTACSSSLSVTVSIPGLNGSIDDYVVFLASANDQYLGGLFSDNSWSHTVSLFNGFKGVIANLPAGLGNVKVVVYAKKGDPTSKATESAMFSPCSKGSISLSFPAPVLPDMIKAHISTVAKCTSKQIVAYPTSWITISDVTVPTTVTTTNAHMVNGVIDVKLISGHSYSMSTSYNGRTFGSGVFKIDKTTNISIPAGTGLSGTAVYNTATQVLNVNAVFTLSKCG
ncbi:hypothetical protein [Mucilaginibacter jinjuensis]|uniref:Uncharacterized protein n=1 Tax=Mucilaginibacter jinjuensis TaxID=1176721 RepID=A0ABY7T7M5_9SPHI|nr:hypothetical protein [Mucilaginibacter jinjuensis]WCT12362.1 hypothetical protein PQO05_00245 [Mucilaginibacter jinjuensis]